MTPHPTIPDPADRDNFPGQMDAFFAWIAVNADEIQAFASGYLLSLTASSTTSLSIGLGSKAFTVASGLGYVAGMEMTAAYTTDPADHSMTGTVLTYSGTTLTLDVTSIRGTGTYALWSISPTAVASFNGQVFTDLVLAGKITEAPVAMPADALDPDLGTFQTRTLSGTTTFTDSLATGESMVLHLTRGANALTWPTMDWLYGDPTIPTGKCVVILWKEGSSLCGCYAGPLL